MYNCPTCRIPLKKGTSQFGILWSCPKCSGRAISIHVLRKAIPQNIINKLWQRAKSGEYKSYRNCPICQKELPEVPIINDDKSICLDVCSKCCFVWFDSREYESLPKLEIQKPKEEELSMEEREAFALLKIKNMKSTGDFAGIAEDDSPERLHQKILSILGYPIEQNVYELKNKPIVTWIIGLIMVIATLLCISDLQYFVDKYGLIPAKFYRDYGFTFLSSFFLHAGIAHLAGNLYFLLVFGDNVEDVLGKKKYILLIILAAFVGDILHIIIDPQKMVPSIGASGGISGILAYYCLRFPDARLSMFYFFYFRYGWFSINVKTFIVLWIFMQVLISLKQTAGMSDVSGLAHLGGASIGVLFWFMEKRSLTHNPSKEVQ